MNKPSISKIKFTASDVDNSRSMVRFNETGDVQLSKSQEFEITVCKGNKKPIPSFVWMVSMQSATNCHCRLNNLCPISDSCYGLDYEENKLFRDATLRCRQKDEDAIDFLVNHPFGASFFASKIIGMSKRVRNQEKQIKFFRWNVTGDLKSIRHLLFVQEVARILYNELGVITILYTHNKDVVESYLEHLEYSDRKSYLKILGSGFMVDSNFDCFANEYDAKCSSNCVECFKSNGVAFCYDIDFNGVIKEDFRE